MHTRFKKFLSLFLALSFAGVLTACNTMEGAGKDIERAGEEIQEGAN